MYEQSAMTVDVPPPDRTELAKFRTSLALDRTTLAWIRTTLTMATFGFGMIVFFRTLSERAQTEKSQALHQAAIHFGTVLVVLGLFATILSGVSHWASLRKIRRDESIPISKWPLSITIALLLSILGLAGLWALLSD